MNSLYSATFYMGIHQGMEWNINLLGKHLMQILEIILFRLTTGAS